eukprot:7805664-Pyramimonas_sp.AAC.1
MGDDRPDVKILQDRFGNLGTKQQNAPLGAAYKRREGTSDTTSFKRTFRFEAGAEDVAEAAFQELQRGGVERAGTVEAPPSRAELVLLPEARALIAPAPRS